MKPLKDKKITIYQTIGSTTAGGFPQYKYRPIHPGQVWAYVRDMSSEEYYNAQVHGTREEAVFIVNWREDITALMRIVYKGVWYEIKRVDAYEGYKDDLKLFAVRTTTPKNENILPYEA